MGRTIDRGFAHKLAEEALKDSPSNEYAKEILSKPKYRVNNRYFDTEEEMSEYLNSEDLYADYYDGNDYSESLIDAETFKIKKSAYCWHSIDEEPIPTDNWDDEFVVRLKNGNKRIAYPSCGHLKDRINGENIPLDIVKLWILLPKDD